MASGEQSTRPDIVRRLRDWAANSLGCNPANAPCAEAADEIERLRAALEQIAKGSRAKARTVAYRALGYPEPSEVTADD